MTGYDALGLPLTADEDTVRLWDRAVDDVLSLHGPAGVEELLEAAPDVAAVQALHAHLVSEGIVDGDAQKSLERAESLLDNVSGRERAYVVTVRRAVTAGMWGSPDPWREYVAAHPGDLLPWYSMLVRVLYGFRDDGAEVGAALVTEVERHQGDHHFVRSMRAMLWQEQGRLDESQERTDAVLAERPDFTPAAHVRSHVLFERGEHRSGLDWLSRWMSGPMREGSAYAPHLRWHLGLHELALDDREAVLRRVLDTAGPDAPGRWMLSNGASYLWRAKLAGLVPMDADPSEGALAEKARPMTTGAPMLFVGWNACVGLGAIGDLATLDEVAAGRLTATAPGTREVLPVLAGALAALLREDPGTAADGLLRVREDAHRIGGSRAQREVLEDTLLAALVRAGRTGEAAGVLEERLDRRPSRGDDLRLAGLHLPAPRRAEPTRPAVPGAAAVRR